MAMNYELTSCWPVKDGPNEKQVGWGQKADFGGAYVLDFEMILEIWLLG